MASPLRTMRRRIKRTERNGVLKDEYLAYREKERKAGRLVLNKRDWIVESKKVW